MSSPSLNREGNVIACVRPPERGNFSTSCKEYAPVKDFVISVNNTVLYLSLAFIWLVAIVAIFTSGFLPALGIFVAGTLCWCIISGFWFVQSATYEELRKLNANKG